MGTFTVGCLIKNHVDREKTVKIPRLMVDTGSDATWIARNLLEKIEIKPEKRSPYQMANGQYVYRDVGYAIIRVGQRETVDEVVFAETGDHMLLGPRALSGLMLWVDPRNKKLVEVKAQPVAVTDTRHSWMVGTPRCGVRSAQQPATRASLAKFFLADPTSSNHCKTPNFGKPNK